MGLESSDVIIFHFEPLLQGQIRVAKLNSVYNFLINAPRGLECEINQ